VDENIIVSEKLRPLWQRIIASLFFTAAIGYFIYIMLYANWRDDNLLYIEHKLESVIYLITLGVAFSFQKSVYIDLKNSKFRSTFGIGPVKLGEWKKITSYEYISIFHEPLIDGNKIFEVNLWYDRNKHWELYEKYDFKEAFLIGVEISDILQIDLLDATIPNNYKWIDKKASIKTGKIVYVN
jgi:hypothetical protein